MKPFQYVRATDEESASREMARSASDGRVASFLAGGTTVLDLMKINVMSPDKIIDIGRIGLDQIDTFDRGVRVGANVRNADLAFNPEIQSRFPLLSEALLSGASAQIRQMATTAGNALQKTRCSYFRDDTAACNKRVLGSGCSALNGFDRSMAVLGTSDSCIATHPSDMCVALIALNAVVHSRATDGSERKTPFGEFYCLPEKTPERENILKPGEIIRHLFVPFLPSRAKSHYLKVRDRASYEFALASAAVVLDIHDSGVIQEARVGLGGVATKPWRATEAERCLTGQIASTDLFERAAELAMGTAVPGRFNKFKIELAQRTLVSALETVAGQFQQSGWGSDQKDKIA